MAKKPTGFDELTTKQKLKAVRDDIRQVLAYANGLQQRLDDLEASLDALRSDHQKLSAAGSVKSEKGKQKPS